MTEELFKYLDVSHIHKGHQMFEINHLEKAVTHIVPFEKNGRLVLIVKEGCEYVAALNMKNAIKRYNKKQ